MGKTRFIGIKSLFMTPVECVHPVNMAGSGKESGRNPSGKDGKEPGGVSLGGFTPYFLIGLREITTFTALCSAAFANRSYASSNWSKVK